MNESLGFGITWGWEIDDRIFIFGWTVLSFSKSEMFWTNPKNDRSPNAPWDTFLIAECMCGIEDTDLYKIQEVRKITKARDL